MAKFTKGSAAAKLAGRKGAAVTNSKKKSKPPTDKSALFSTDYYLLVDKSGSIATCGLTQKVRETIQAQIDSFLKTPGIVHGTINQFGEPAYFIKGDRTPVAKLKAPEYSAYDGSTGIIDGLRKTLHQSMAAPVSQDYAVVVIIITDGEENVNPFVGWVSDSRFGQNKDVTDLVKQLTDGGHYTFVGVGPQSSRTFFQKLGIPDGNVSTWETTVQGTQDMSVTLSGSTQSYGSVTRASGQTATKSYFTPNLAKLKTTTVKKELTDRSKDFKSWTVDKEVPIKEFVESAGATFYLGAGYYPLTKMEKVQNYKNILLVKKGTKTVYTGAEAREVLGLPATGTVIVTPGNHGDWDIYIQSTSHNRKLVRGTKLYWDLTIKSDLPHTWVK